MDGETVVTELMEFISEVFLDPSFLSVSIALANDQSTQSPDGELGFADALLL